MKHFGPFSLVWCLLIALSVLFSGFGFLDSGKTLSHGMAVDEETFEDFEEEDLFEDFSVLCAFIGFDELDCTHFFASSFTLSFLNDRITSVNPSGWLMPVRI